MNLRLCLFCFVFSNLVSLIFGADAQKPHDDVVILKPYVVEAKSLAHTGFEFLAKFRYHLITAGIKELIITKVESRSVAKKAGLEVGEKIIQVWDMKVEGLKIKELKKLFERKTEDGKIPLTIQSKDSGVIRKVVLQWSEREEPEKKALN